MGTRKTPHAVVPSVDDELESWIRDLGGTARTPFSAPVEDGDSTCWTCKQPKITDLDDRLSA